MKRVGFVVGIVDKRSRRMFIVRANFTFLNEKKGYLQPKLLDKGSEQAILHASRNAVQSTT